MYSCSFHYIINKFKTLCYLDIKLVDYHYELNLKFGIYEDDMDSIESKTGRQVYSSDFDLANRYIRDYIKNVLKIDFKKDDLNEKLFLYFGLKLDLNDKIVLTYNNDIIVTEDFIYLSSVCTVKDVLEDLNKLFILDEYNNIDKFIDDNINDKNMLNSVYLKKMFEYCTD